MERGVREVTEIDHPLNKFLNIANCLTSRASISKAKCRVKYKKILIIKNCDWKIPWCLSREG